MRGRRVLLGSLVVGVAAGSLPAVAQDCEPTNAKEVQALITQAREAVEVSEDVERYRLLERNLELVVPCLVEKVPTEAWARMLYLGALVRHATGQPWEAWLDAALDVDPLLVRDLGHEEVRTRVPDVPVVHRVPKRSSGLVFFADGKASGLPYSLVGPHILQLRGEGGLRSQWTVDGEMPQAWSDAFGLSGGVGTTPDTGDPSGPPGDGGIAEAPPPSSPPHTAPASEQERSQRLALEQARTAEYRRVKSRADKLLAGGVGLLGGGALLAGGSIAVAYTIYPERYSPEASALIGLEITGWSLAAVGVGITVAGALEGKRARGLMAGVRPQPGGAGVFLAGNF